MAASRPRTASRFFGKYEKAASGQTTGGEEIIKDLVSNHSADLNLMGNDDYATVFSFIVHHCSLNLIKWCLDKGAIISPKNSEDKIIPLQTAAVRDDAEEVFKYLVEKGADINQKGINHFPPIFASIRRGHLNLVQYCIQKGAKLEPGQVQRAFELAVSSRNIEVFSALEHEGYKFTFSEENAVQLLYDAYTPSNLAMLEKMLSYNPSLQALNEYVDKITDKLILHNDARTLKLLARRGAILNDKLKTEFQHELNHDM